MAENRFLYDTIPYHNIVMKDRKDVQISGVKLIDHFDEEEFLIESVQGWVEILGKELSLDKLDKEKGEVIIKGHIDSITYTSSQKTKESLFGKLFK